MNHNDEYLIKRQTASQAVEMFEQNYDKNLSKNDKNLLIDFVMFIQFNILTKKELIEKYTNNGENNV